MMVARFSIWVVCVVENDARVSPSTSGFFGFGAPAGNDEREQCAMRNAIDASPSSREEVNPEVFKKLAQLKSRGDLNSTISSQQRNGKVSSEDACF